jgi:hypothetical protein
MPFVGLEAVTVARRGGDPVQGRGAHGSADGGHPLPGSSYAGLSGTSDGDMRKYAGLTREAIALAEESGDPALYLALSVNSYGFWCIGEYGEGVAVCDRAIELAAGDPTVGAGTTMACPYANCHGLKGWNMMLLGDLDQARKLIEQGADEAAGGHCAIRGDRPIPHVLRGACGDLGLEQDGWCPPLSVKAQKKRAAPTGDTSARRRQSPRQSSGRLSA